VLFPRYGIFNTNASREFFLHTLFLVMVHRSGGSNMCDSEGYTEFPPYTIGGGTGDYFIQCPIVSCQWAEYSIDSIVNGDGGTGAFVVSSERPPVAMDYTGAAANKMSDNASLQGVPLRLAQTTMSGIKSPWTRIVNSQKRVFVRIDAAASTSMFITVRFRIRDLAIIPSPSAAGHHDAMDLVNQDREMRIKERLGQMGIPAYAQEK
jgi:hypothetical protein